MINVVSPPENPIRLVTGFITLFIYADIVQANNNLSSFGGFYLLSE